ncbi:MAG: hypothetical protein M3O35_06535 [Acidobacteriota bacterium]|nr:hypothetical protein [Acidobacteriota bacterium]
MDPIKAIGLILIASFLVDRIVAGLFFLLDFSASWRKKMPDPDLIQNLEERAGAARKRKLVYSLMAGFLGIVVIAWYLDIRLLALTNLLTPDAATGKLKPRLLLDILLTGLIVAGGADRMAEALKMLGGPGVEKPGAGARPVEITGKLVLEREKEHEPDKSRAVSFT